MWSRSSPTRQFPFRAVSTSTRCPSACRSPAVFAATASSWTRPRRWNRPLPTSQASDARAPTLTSSLGLRSTSNRSRPTRPYRPRPLNADFRRSSSPASSELDLDPLALLRARGVSTGAVQSRYDAEPRQEIDSHVVPSVVMRQVLRRHAGDGLTGITALSRRPAASSFRGPLSSMADPLGNASLPINLSTAGNLLPHCFPRPVPGKQLRQEMPVPSQQLGGSRAADR